MASKTSVEQTSTPPAAAGAKPLSVDNAAQTEADTDEIRVTPYREAVGALIWAATMTRLDVAYAAHKLGKINDSSGQYTGGRQKGHYNTCGAQRMSGSPTE